ncbi:hypothetical protein D3C84_540410 [compost metagenome]
MAKHAATVIEVALELHIADGAEAVEPTVGGLLHGLGKAYLFDLFHQRGTGANYACRERTITDKRQIAFLLQRFDAHAGDAGFADAKQRCALGHCGNEGGACLGGVAFDVVSVHTGFT